MYVYMDVYTSYHYTAFTYVYIICVSRLSIPAHSEQPVPASADRGGKCMLYIHTRAVYTYACCIWFGCVYIRVGC